MKITRENNFDIIRLLAAIQVLITHTIEHMDKPSPSFMNFDRLLTYFPGVPIFFTISGFLIYSTFDRTKNVKKYLKNRFLRIYPGLWGCLLFTLICLIIFRFININSLINKKFWEWIISQISFFQFYTPNFLRGYGLRNPNGSLWTIPIELSFYFLVPIIFFFQKKIRSSPVILITILFSCSFLFNLFYRLHFNMGDNQPTRVKIFSVSLLPYLFYFLTGTVSYIYWERIKKWYQNKGIIWVLVYIVYFIIFSIWLKKFQPSYWPNLFGLLAIILLSQTVLALAYSSVHLSRKILNRNDISYGIYLYHIPVLNILIQLGYRNYWLLPEIILLLTIIISYISWVFIEKPSLSLKNNSIYVHS